MANKKNNNKGLTQVLINVAGGILIVVIVAAWTWVQTPTKNLRRLKVHSDSLRYLDSEIKNIKGIRDTVINLKSSVKSYNETVAELKQIVRENTERLNNIPTKSDFQEFKEDIKFILDKK